ncbi:MAG TPA: VOC family protein [Vicinamibacterales bacterium]|jgi:predicted enzyme related to lactoylglutathione lyase
MKLKYAIKFVADMDRAVAFHRDVLKLDLAFQTPEWSEFDTGQTRLALHPASEGYPPGSVQLAFASEDLDGFYDARQANAVAFVMPPTELPGRRVARILDCEGAEVSVADDPGSKVRA